MLGLKLRDEFLGSHMPGTAISLRTNDKAAQKSAGQILKITYPTAAAVRTSDRLKNWCRETSSSGKAVLILDALSLRELPSLVTGAKSHGIEPTSIKVTGSECPSTTDHFAAALGLPSRSALANDGKPGTFALFDACYTDVLNIPFEDCAVPPTSNIVIWKRRCLLSLEFLPSEKILEI